MAYSDYTLETAVETFDLEIVEPVGFFSGLEAIDPGKDFTTHLANRVQLADAINTDKAKSELIISNVIAELRQHHNCCISFFSGTDFDVDAESGLDGVCDFLISLSPTQLFIRAPVAILIEVPPIAGKDESIIIGLGPCVAKMVAAQRFNAKKSKRDPVHLRGYYQRHRVDVPSIGRAETQHRSNVLPNRAMRQNPRYPLKDGQTKGISPYRRS